MGVLQVSKTVMDLIRNALRDVTAEGGTAGALLKGGLLKSPVKPVRRKTPPAVTMVGL